MASVVESIQDRAAPRAEGPTPAPLLASDETAAHAAVAASGDVVYTWTTADDRIAWGGHAAALFGGTETPPRTGTEWTRLIHAEDSARRSEEIAARGGAQASFDCEYRIHGPGGRSTWIHDCGTVERGPDGRPVCYRGVLRNISRRKQREARLEYLTNFDELTGHFNRARLKQSLEHAIAYTGRYAAPSAYLVVGVDRLTAIVDAMGTEAADTVIAGVGRVLDRCLRASDVIGRIGGDRFGIVLANCRESEVQDAAERILDHIRRTAMDLPGGPTHITVSIGGATIGDHTMSTDEVFGRADSALAKAKQAGRDCFLLYCDSSEQRETRRRAIAILEEVQSALKSERLVLAFQPIVAALDRRVDHYECLVRLKREDGTILPAGAFIPAVEQSPLMRLVDRRALELAIHELEAHPDIRLAINISGLTAADRSWLRTMNALMRGRPDLARRLIVEITETVALSDIEETARFVAAVRDLGCRVALDDFGAGYSSFRNLKALSVDCVKIDGSFVRGLTTNIDNQLFIRTLLGLADGFGLDTVAECVETAEEANHLVRRGVRFLQGYHFGRPSVERPWVTRASGLVTPPPPAIVS